MGLNPPVFIRGHPLLRQLPADPISFFRQDNTQAVTERRQRRCNTAQAATGDHHICGKFPLVPEFPKLPRTGFTTSQQPIRKNGQQASCCSGQSDKISSLHSLFYVIYPNVFRMLILFRFRAPQHGYHPESCWPESPYTTKAAAYL